MKIHADLPDYRPELFKPFRLVILMLKCLRLIKPDYEIWRDHEYQYEPDRLPIDVINGSADLRQWIDDGNASVNGLDRRLLKEANRWREKKAPYLLYPD